MQQIMLPDEVYSILAILATERHITPEDLIAALTAEATWEEHAAQAYDAYIARQETTTHEALSDDEFLAWLHEISTYDIDKR